MLALVVFLFAAAAAQAGPPLTASMKQVERIRGLSFLRDVAHEEIGRDDLRDRLREQMTKTMPYSTDDYALVLRALQLVDDDKTDVISRMLNLYESQVLAFYDPLSHKYYSIRDLGKQTESLGTGDAGVLDDAVEIHELTHALQDQRFGAGTRDLALIKDTDAGLAYHTLLEGEASVVMLAYVMGKSGVSLDTIAKNDQMVNQMTNSMASSDKSMDGTPRYFSESLMFPYARGIKLVLEAYKRGGWHLVNRMDANPPRSAREVIHYNEYFARLDRGGEPAPFDPHPAAGVTAPLTVEHLGEFHWGFLVGDRNALGWLDDRVTVTQNAFCKPTVLVETKWDSERRARSFREAYLDFLRKRGLEPIAGGDATTVRVAYGADDALMERFVR